MKRLAVTLLVIAAMPLIVVGSVAMWAMYNKDAAPIRFMEND